MKASGWRSHRFLRGSMTTAGVVALVAIGVPAAALASHQAPHARPSSIGPGYPPPGGIYAPFTNCPLLDSNMQEAVFPPGPGPLNDLSVVGCAGGAATSGSITIGNITTPVVRPVNVQYGFYTPPGATYGGDNPSGVAEYAGGVLPPPAGLSAMLVTKPDLIPQSLTTALGCATATNKVVKNLCSEAENYGGRYLDVYALAQSAGQITNFGLLSWTQRIKFKLINPLLGNSCYIGSSNNPIVINPQLSVAPGGQFEELPDPNPAKHPNTFVLAITKAIASDTTFTAPGVTGCGPGGAANMAIDEALDSGTGLPSASGTNSLTLNGAFGVAANEYGIFSQPQTAPPAKVLLSAFKASSKSAGTRQTVRPLSPAQAHRLLRRLGLHSG
jgi:hypothetical protein